MAWERKNTAGMGLIPPQSYREGDFSSTLGSPLFDSTGTPVNVCTTEGGTTQLRQGMVFDPTTGNPSDGTGRCVFSSNGRLNVIPSNRIADRHTLWAKWSLQDADVLQPMEHGDAGGTNGFSGYADGNRRAYLDAFAEPGADRPHR